MNKHILVSFGVVIIALVGLLISSSSQNVQDDNQSTLGAENFIQCLAEQEVVVYGSETCPACLQFAQQFGGYKEIEPIFVECNDNREECATNMQTNYVPEIQIEGVLFEGVPTPENLSRATGCENDSANR